ncbi:MAG: ATPase, T2SS/T4P/T4SS family [Vulcanibacillus sp.]
MKLDDFYIDNYIELKQNQLKHEKNQSDLGSKYEIFQRLCLQISKYFLNEWENEQGKSSSATDKLLQYQKRAIIGYPQEVNFFIAKINEYLKKNGLQSEWFPKWYQDLTSAIFHEYWGLAGIAEWKKMKDSSSAKIIGEKIFFLINGHMKLQDQKITPERFKQLRKALLLRNPEIHLNEKYAEVYMLDGTRITIFDDAKEPTIIFRKYIIDNLTFEEQAKRGSIPFEVIPMLKAKIKLGYNINFIGPVRSGKTTFLKTWQSYEDKTLEGVMVETDPEIPLHVLMPEAPIIQITADGDRLKSIIKPLMRSDADYFIIAEARDAVALYIALKITTKGTRRVKSTFHTSDAIDFVYDAACEIIQEFGGELWPTIIKVAKGYNYLYEFVQLKDKRKKRLKGIYEIRYDPITFAITIHQIMKYDFQSDNWTYKFDIGRDKEEIALQEDPDSFTVFQSELRKLAVEKPMIENHIKNPAYINFLLNR